ncbi:hypothetical protein PIB30_026429 [Stylosanthes scabra]|uniref:F-box associated beta-propeller type 1 domain-containing protein n=1 Tax=Stylosanthes scabra TaxID=79078 RepID=A0ABU6TAK4_9FABA|nr:hypothetical protein [Stylosanthes scabra]
MPSDSRIRWTYQSIATLPLINIIMCIRPTKVSPVGKGSAHNLQGREFEPRCRCEDLVVKDVLRSKCVCKNWKSLICEPQFCYEHTLRLCRKYKQNPNPNPYPYPSGILLQRYIGSLLPKKADIIPFTNNNSNSNKRFAHLHHAYNKLDELRHYQIQQSCNGLLLWQSTPQFVLYPPYDAGTKEVLHQGCSFYVSNPTTGHYVPIDQFGHEFHRIFSRPFLVFEPWKSPHYKIIFFTKVEGDRKKLTTKMKMSVYSSATKSWSRVDLLPSFPNSNLDYGVYCNGAIHWYAVGKYSMYFDIDRLCLKNLPTLELPGARMIDLEVVYFGECGGNLHLIVARIDEKLRYDILELKEDYSEWMVRYYIDLSTIESRNSTVFGVSCVVRQPPKEDENEESKLAIVSVDYEKLVAYNLKDHSSRIFYEGGFVPYIQHQYFETLAGM